MLAGALQILEGNKTVNHPLDFAKPGGISLAESSSCTTSAPFLTCAWICFEPRHGFKAPFLSHDTQQSL